MAKASESKGRIFSSFFLNNWARVRSFSSSLPQQTNNSFTAMKTSSGTFDGGGVKGAAKLSFATTEGKSANIWLTFTRGPNSFYLPLDGNYSCARRGLQFFGPSYQSDPFVGLETILSRGRPSRSQKER